MDLSLSRERRLSAEVKSREYRSHRGLDIADIGLAFDNPWEPLDHYSQVAAKHLVGLICFLVPVVQLVYVAAHWRESKEALYLLMSGLAMAILAALTGVLGPRAGRDRRNSSVILHPSTMARRRFTH
jgi:hypothetical protein